MDTSVISDSIESLLGKLESLDEDHLDIPFISNRIHEFKDKLILSKTLAIDHPRDLLRRIVSDPDLSWEEENESRLSIARDALAIYDYGVPETLRWRNAGLLTCFLYCTLYPQGHSILREDLVNQWMAQGFLLGSEDEELLGIGNGYFNEMLSEGVFQEATYAYGTTPSDEHAVVHSCVMHPLAYDAARLIAPEHVSVFDGSTVGSITQPRYTKYVAFHNFDNATQVVDSDEPEISRKTTTLMLFSSRVPNSAKFDLSWLRFPNLCVLHLHGSMQIAELPVETTRGIRYLALSRDDANGVLPIHELGLQTLRLISGSLPVLGINTKSMRHLYLTTMDSSLDLSGETRGDLRILELSRCQSLRTLKIAGSSFSFTPSTSSPLLYLYLTTLRIFDCPKLRYLPKLLFLTHVEELVFHDCPRLRLTNGTAMDALPKLRYLEIIGVHKVAELPSGIQRATSLQYMMIGDCRRLRRLIPDGTTIQNLTSLQRLCIYNCPRLTALPDGIDTLTDLHAPYVRHCPNLVSSYHNKDSDELAFISSTCLGRERKENQMPSSSQMDSKFRQFVPYFTLQSQIMQDAVTSSGGVEEEYGDEKGYSRWDVLGSVLRAVFKMRALVKESIEDKKLRCSLIPCDYEFERETLVQQWMAGGLLNAAPGILKNKPMEDVGNYYFDKLVRDSFLLRSRLDVFSCNQIYTVNLDNETIKATSMDGLRMIESENPYTNLEVVDEDGVDRSMKQMHISLTSDCINETTFDKLKRFTQLRTLLFLRDYGSSLTKVPYDMFLALRKLHSLNLSGSHISELPSSIEYVKELRFLDLSFTLIQELPESLGCLTELQTLKLRGCKRLFTLPNSTQRLVSLRHLDFDVLRQLACMAPGIGALTELRTLVAFVVGKGKGRRITELSTLSNLSGSLCISGLENIVDNNCPGAALSEKTHITRLQLRWNPNSCMSKSNADQPDNVIGDLRPDYFGLKELLILYFPGKHLPIWMGDAQFVNLVSIRLIRCENVELDVSLGELPVLKYLHIDQMHLVMEIDSRFRGADEKPMAFEKLEELSIDGMHRLKAWKDVQSSDFPLLSKLIVRSCHELTALPFTSLPGSLKHLEISGCAMLQSLQVAELFSSLETLIIDD